jgi:hypothetical protein
VFILVMCLLGLASSKFYLIDTKEEEKKEQHKPPPVLTGKSIHSFRHIFTQNLAISRAITTCVLWLHLPEVAHFHSSENVWQNHVVFFRKTT